MPQRLFIDYETYYSTEYSLSRMTTREYIMDPRFEVIGASIGVDDGEIRWYDEDKLQLVLATFDWDTVQFVAHNTMFDGAITQWKYGHTPKLWLDTMGMAQATLTSETGSASLAAVGAHFGLTKDKGALVNMKGRRAADVDRTSSTWARYTEYANSDVENCRIIFNNLINGFPPKELILIDTLLRMYIDGNITIDQDVVGDSLHEVKSKAEETLRRAGIPNKTMLRSRDQFAKLLMSHGVTPPTKISSANGEKTYAFAKNDLSFTQLLNHDNPQVVALVDAKLNASSTIEETRAQRFMNLSQLDGKVLNVPLRYSAAHTHRMGGSDSLNLQNLPRDSPLRHALTVPAGSKMVVVDASQIEARVLAWIAKCHSITNAFAVGEDVYSTFASKVFGYPVNKKEHPSERFIGKTGILSLGYAVGWRKVQWALLTNPQYDGEVPDLFAQNLVDTYRNTYSEIPAFWDWCDGMLKLMTEDNCNEDWGPLKIRRNHIILPSGLKLHYPQLHYVNSSNWEERGYMYYDSKYKCMSKIYGGALCAHICQALARVIVTDTLLWMRLRNPEYFLALFVHDELVYVVPEHLATRCYKDLMYYMTLAPDWAPGIPLAAEGGVGTVYGDIK